MRQLRNLVLGVLAGVVGLLSTQPGAFAANANLSSVVLSNTFPGMVATAPGADNGPINPANLQLLGMSPALASTLSQHIANGDVSGYIRLWSRQPPNGDAVVISAFQYSNPAGATAMLAGENFSLIAKPGVTTFAVPGIAGASGYTVPTATSSGTSVSGHFVFFNVGGTSVQVIVVSQSGDLTVADAVTLANRQAANTPASSSGSSSPAYRAGEIFAAVAAGLVIVWAIMAVIRRSRKSAPSAGAPAPVVAAPSGPRFDNNGYPRPPREGTPIGWTMNPTNMNEQFFWNGSEWAGRRRWVGRAWVDEQPVPS